MPGTWYFPLKDPKEQWQKTKTGYLLPSKNNSWKPAKDILICQIQYDGPVRLPRTQIYRDTLALNRISLVWATTGSSPRQITEISIQWCSVVLVWGK